MTKPVGFYTARTGDPGDVTFQLGFVDVSAASGQIAGTRWVHGLCLTDDSGNTVAANNPLPISEASGAAITGAAMPAGGVGLTGWLSAIWKALTGTLSVSDAQSAPFGGAVAMTAGTTYAAQRSVGVLCATAGNVQFQFPDSSTMTLPVSIGWQTFPFACTQIVAAGTTATATFFNLK